METVILDVDALDKDSVVATMLANTANVLNAVQPIVDNLSKLLYSIEDSKMRTETREKVKKIMVETLEKIEAEDLEPIEYVAVAEILLKTAAGILEATKEVYSEFAIDTLSSLGAIPMSQSEERERLKGKD